MHCQAGADRRLLCSDGALTIDPDGGNPLFETPIVPPRARKG